MYSQCPACLTTFKVSPAQLEARGGMVRCGICSAIFHAKQRLLQVAPTVSAASIPAPEAVSTKKIKLKRTSKNRRHSGRRRSDKIQSIDEKLALDADIPTVTELQGLTQPRSFWRPLFWGFGNVLLLALITGQFVFFYHDELAVNPSWRPWIMEFCRYASCEIRPLRDIARIELLQTTIAPHPKFGNALRIRATLVNRAAFSQPYPAMEIGLTSNTGSLLARRTFAPAHYLETPDAGAMSPNVVATTVLDVTNPDGKAVGYEIRLVTP